MPTSASKSRARNAAAHASTGPKTPDGKAVSARNATTHGLFCRQTVLPHLGEDPAGYQLLLDTLNAQLRPRNLMEKQYLELWADASWKLRRLSRLEAQVWEADGMNEDTRLTKIERLNRLQNSLRRQMDKSVRMLNQDVHDLYAQRLREDVMPKMGYTEAHCQANRYSEQNLQSELQANLVWPSLDERDTPGLDNIPLPPSAAPQQASSSLAPISPELEAGGPSAPLPSSASGEVAGLARTERVPDTKNCQNELPSSPSPLEGEGRSLATGERDAIGERDATGERDDDDAAAENEDEEDYEDEEEYDDASPARSDPREQEYQELESLLNSGTLSSRERTNIMMNSNAPGFNIDKGHITVHRR